jgi:integrase
MALHFRRRGEVWHARGTVRVGRETFNVSEFSTGSRSRADAEAVAAAEEARIRQSVLDGPAGRARTVTIAEAFEPYLLRPGGIAPWDKTMVSDLNERIGHRSVADAPAAWQDWLRIRGHALSPASVARWRATFVAALNVGCKALGLGPSPAIQTVRQRPDERVAHLHDVERQRLLAAYNPHAACPVLLLAYGGLRSQEALQLDWRDVYFLTRVIRLPKTKSGRVRTVPMHRRVDALLFGLWHAAGKPTRGPVFISAKGKPYSDTRGQGGNPLAQAHETACAAAGVTDFRVHDWRHDFATRFLTEGGDVRGLMQIMGWSSPRMVARYVTYRVEHLAAVLQRVA